jgi:hypothetical protein
MQTFRVDFNDQTEDGRIVALSRLASGPGEPRIGLRVTMRDGEGNSCSGRIAAISGALIEIQPNWDSWVPVEDLFRSPTRYAFHATTPEFHLTVPSGFAKRLEAATVAQPRD